MTIKCILPIKLLFTLTALACTSLCAQEKDWWFDVELIVFKRDIDPGSLAEKFEHYDSNIESKRMMQLIEPYLWPDIGLVLAQLPDCYPHQGDTDVDTQSHFTWQVPNNLGCRFEQEKDLWPPASALSQYRTTYKATPLHLDGEEDKRPGSAQLLSQSSLELNSLYQAIDKKRDLIPIMHMGWRQPVLFGRNKAASLHLFAGQNYAEHFGADGLPLPATAPSMQLSDIPAGLEQNNRGLMTTNTSGSKLFETIRQALSSNDPAVLPMIKHQEKQKANNLLDDISAPTNKLDQLWELDGLFKVYLQNIQTTPYLHIDSKLNFLGPVRDERTQTTVLKRFQFNQLRRVISTEIHYFDHPLFGFIVQIRRFNMPEPEKSGPDSEQ